MSWEERTRSGLPFERTRSGLVRWIAVCASFSDRTRSGLQRTGRRRGLPGGWKPPESATPVRCPIRRTPSAQLGTARNVEPRSTGRRCGPRVEPRSTDCACGSDLCRWCDTACSRLRIWREGLALSAKALPSPPIWRRDLAPVLCPKLPPRPFPCAGCGSTGFASPDRLRGGRTWRRLGSGGPGRRRAAGFGCATPWRASWTASKTSVGGCNDRCS
jgi:hypothetical protein